MVQAPISKALDVLGSLEEYPYYHTTPDIGTCFSSSETQISSFLDDDNKIKDLATLVSHRGVVFFTNQDITIAQQKLLGQKLGKLSGGPPDSGLHVHPISEDVPELGKDVSVISSMGGIARAGTEERSRASKGWHADITFECVPSDYAILKMHTLPEVGGDTLWASGYEAYDRLSPAMQKFLEGLHAVHNGNFFVEYAKRHGLAIQDPRGAPDNYGTDLTAPRDSHKPRYGLQVFIREQILHKRIVELTKDESDDILDYLSSLSRHVSENHDLQVRFRWGKNDLAIWDNRSTFHTATNDYGTNALRQGNRIVSLGERPFFDPNSRSRREALGIVN